MASHGHVSSPGQNYEQMGSSGGGGLQDRSMRSVFVGNIPYDATEEQLKDIFQEVGPVLSFRLVFDRETGRPKGYGFCEYKDAETASSAMRNLNGYELGGRTLRVDNACTDKAKEELKNLQVPTPPAASESGFGPEIDADRAPEAISKAVASLPPEQMFELAKQMKACVQNNPNEARNMLLQNPQLAYALLQALVIMKVVDPQAAANILCPPYANAQPIMPSNQPPPAPVIGGDRFPRQPPTITPGMAGHMPPRPVDPRLEQRPVDPRLQPPTGGPIPQAVVPPVDPRQPPVRDPRQPPVSDPRIPRSASIPVTSQAPVSTSAGPRVPPPGPGPAAPPSTVPSPAVSDDVAAEQAKAALIMQVLQLTDQQIAMLPPDQRESIRMLKAQLGRNN